MEPTFNEWQDVDNPDLCLSSSQRWATKTGKSCYFLVIFYARACLGEASRLVGGKGWIVRAAERLPFALLALFAFAPSSILRSGSPVG